MLNPFGLKAALLANLAGFARWFLRFGMVPGFGHKQKQAIPPRF